MSENAGVGSDNSGRWQQNPHRATKRTREVTDRNHPVTAGGGFAERCLLRQKPPNPSALWQLRELGPISFAKLVDTPDYLRKVRALMNHQSTNLCTQQRSALKVHAWNLAVPCGAPPRALDDVMR
jgi:hypothetical protein